jgi:spore maturation protein CgeB
MLALRLTSSSPEEWVDQTRFYIAHSEAAARLRETGYRRDLPDYTERSQFEVCFEK